MMYYQTVWTDFTILGHVGQSLTARSGRLVRRKSNDLAVTRLISLGSLESRRRDPCYNDPIIGKLYQDILASLTTVGLRGYSNHSLFLYSFQFQSFSSELTISKQGRASKRQLLTVEKPYFEVTLCR
jgi:hypothetical protein